MLRFLSRFLGIWLIAAALVAAVVDGAKSIAASRLVLTPMAESFSALAALAGGGTEPAAGLAAPPPLNLLVGWLSSAPTAPVLAVLGILLLVAGRRRRSAYIGREFAA